jgi:hypothetical protein
MRSCSRFRSQKPRSACCLKKPDCFPLGGIPSRWHRGGARGAGDPLREGVAEGRREGDAGRRPRYRSTEARAVRSPPGTNSRRESVGIGDDPRGSRVPGRQDSEERPPTQPATGRGYHGRRSAKRGEDGAFSVGEASGPRGRPPWPRALAARRGVRKARLGSSAGSGSARSTGRREPGASGSRPSRRWRRCARCRQRSPRS